MTALPALPVLLPILGAALTVVFGTSVLTAELLDGEDKPAHEGGGRSTVALVIGPSR